ncbi:MAG TPA: MBL fold metallo-hydrolase [Candidatus Cybelea sp.]|nr:MBL fold metallo-hydrolase [Candidatus Cybelea sp.]
MRVTILGCGTSAGVPRVGNDWGACDPDEPKNRRRRCSILVQEGRTTVLVDTSPDLREQLLDAKVTKLDGVLWTHDHADQCHGIDDLRPLWLHAGGKLLDAWTNRQTMDVLMQRFGYCFRQAPGSMYPPILRGHELHRSLDIGELRGIEAIEQDHGFGVVSLGFRFGRFAYSNDVVELDEAAFTALAGIEVWLVDAMRYKPHPTHTHVERTLEWIARVKPKRAILTNMHIDLDYQTLRRELPPGVEPAYDGMQIDL